MKNRSFLVLTFLFAFLAFLTNKAQTNNVAILLNEYSVGNTGYADNYGLHDAVEIYNAHTSSVSLQGYYLSNDKNNLYKWKFPTSFTLGVGGYGMVYLSGINESKLQAGVWYHHANFTLEQCKNQWLILTTPQGVIRDSVFVQHTMVGHTRGRTDYFNIGIKAWKLYTAHSFPLQNPSVGFYEDYMPMPTFTPQAGWNQNGQTLQILVDGVDADSTGTCNEVHYTMDGSYPSYSSPVYTGSLSNVMIIDNMVFRAVNFPKSGTSPTYTPNPFCYNVLKPYLPSFCETNTYFSESSGSFDNFSQDFGVLAVTIHTTDTNYFNTSGVPSKTVHLEYFDKKQQITEGYGDIVRPPQESWLTKQRGFYMQIDDRKGYGCNFEGNIFNVPGLGVTTRTMFPTLHVKAGDFESHSSPSTGTNSASQGTGIRDVFIQSLAAKYNLKVNPLHIKPIILFINAKYQGVYDLREVYDKYYENFYNGSPKDSMDLQFYYNNDGFVQDWDGTTSMVPPNTNFRTGVYDWATTKPMNNVSFYNTLVSRLDKESFIDYHILNSYTMNSDLWNFNVAFARGASKVNTGKWHYYLWNMPATYTFQALQTNTLVYGNYNLSPCATYSAPYSVSALGGNGHGNILRVLMHPITGSKTFQLDYKNRYQDLLNGPLKCENILAHYDYVVNLFTKEARYHEDPGSTPGPGKFVTQMGEWDTNTVHLRNIIARRCDYMATAFSQTGCYQMVGPHDIRVDVYPPNAGSVKLNTVILPYYAWSGKYYNTTMSFKAIPTTTAYVFHHWEFKNHVTKNNDPLSKDSVGVDFNQPDEVLAVFTDITQDVDMPTGFTPNGDGNNDQFKPVGSALYTKEFDFRIWNRWGQEVFRSTDPNTGWDGNFEGKQAQTGVYAYVITYKNVYGEDKIKKGNVTLVR